MPPRRSKSEQEQEQRAAFELVLEQMREANAASIEAGKTALAASQTAIAAARAHENAQAVLNGTVESAHAANRTSYVVIETLIQEKLTLSRQLGDALKANQEIEVRLHAQELAAQEKMLAAKKQIELLATIKQLGGQAMTMYQAAQLPPGTSDALIKKLHEIVPRISSETMGMLVADVGKANVEELLRIAYNQPAAEN